MSKLDDIKVGDEVALQTSCYGRHEWQLFRVTRTTSAQIVISMSNMIGTHYERKFWRKGGAEVGARTGEHRWLHALDDDAKAKIQSTADEQERDRLHSEIRGKAHRLTLDQLRRIEAILKEPT